MKTAPGSTAAWFVLVAVLVASVAAGPVPAPALARPRGPTPLGPNAPAIPMQPARAPDAARGGPSAKVEAAPLKLTTSDGAGLALVSLEARAVVEDPLAFTELHLRFHNPENRTREGRFQITLPPGATISRFAMKIGGAWMEGEVVERQAARRAYEDFLHRKQDPALLENESGNLFSARVFPIPARSDKELIVAYSQELVEADAPYRLPLVGLPRLQELDARILVGRSTTRKAATSLGGTLSQHESIEVHKRDFKPDQDLVVDRAARRADSRVGLRHENLVVARISPVTGTTKPATLSGLRVLFDTSASRALGFEGEVERLGALIAALRAQGDFDLEVFAFDQDVSRVYGGRAKGWGPDDERHLLARGTEGASNLVAALAALDRPANEATFDRLLLISDGMATAGPTEGDAIRGAVTRLSSKGVHRLDVMAVGGMRDDAQLTAMARAGLPESGLVFQPDADVAEMSRGMRLTTRSGLQVTVPGATWVWPTRLDGMQPGDEILVYADLPAKKAFSVMVDGVEVTRKGALFVTERPLIERAWVKARIDRIADQRDGVAAGDADLRSALRKQMIELSTKHRVLCEATALLVLETEADYRRFNLDRRALADILVVGMNGIEVESRTATASADMPIADVALRPLDRKGAARSLRAETPGSMRARSPSAVTPSPTETFDSEFLSNLPLESRTAGDVAEVHGEEEDGAGEALEGKLVQGVVGGVAGGGVGGSVSGSAAPSPARAAPALEPTLARGPRQRARREIAAPRDDSDDDSKGLPALAGELAEVRGLLARGDKKNATSRARAFRHREPGDVLAIVALGEALRESGRRAEAARVFGSIIDLHPSRADLRRYVAGQLEALGDAGLPLAVDCLKKAAEQRPDHPSSHHLFAMALLKSGDARAAFEAVANGLKQNYPEGRFENVTQILREDLGLMAAVWAARESSEKDAIAARVHALGGHAETERSLRFVLTWETDANDVDFHISDAHGGHAYYSERQLPSGGLLYGDVTTGYGPECFTIRGAQRGTPYRLSAHYYSRGPMGYGMGRLEIIDHDGEGGIRFETRPFVVMNDGAFVDMGRFEGRR